MVRSARGFIIHLRDDQKGKVTSPRSPEVSDKAATEPGPDSVAFHPGLIHSFRGTSIYKILPAMRGCQTSPAAHCILRKLLFYRKA